MGCEGTKRLTHKPTTMTKDLVEQLQSTAVQIQARADKLADAHSERQFLEVSEDLKELARRLDRIAKKVYPTNKR